MNDFVENLMIRTSLRVEDYMRTRNFAAHKSGLRTFGSFFIRDYVKKLSAYESYLVHQYDTDKQNRVISRALSLIRQNPEKRISQTNTEGLSRSIILKKRVGETERGVLLVSFENELQKVLDCPGFQTMEKDYQIIFLPTWQPIFSVPLLVIGARSTLDFFVMPSSLDNMKHCGQISSRCRPLPFNAASWVNEDFYPSKSVTKDIDIIMLANFSKYKRHWLLFEALRDLSQNLVVVLAGTPLGNRTRESLIREAKAFQVENSFQIVERPSDDELVDLLSRSKILCALSSKEGAYIAVAEALMANTPVGMYSNAIIGCKSYINEKTGVLFEPHQRLAPQIADFLAKSHTFRPAEWARDNICARKNGIILNEMLKSHSISKQLPWSQDIESFYSKHFDFYYYGGPDCEGAFKDTYMRFQEEIGLTIKRPTASDYKF
jgi:glycosyltransferase involved in cell wall biosynthesis